MHDERDLEELFDRAISSYADQEPEPSLRARIYACTIESAPRPIRRWLLGTAAACAAALLFALLLPLRTSSPPPQSPAAPSIASAPESPAPVTAVARQTTHPHAVRAIHRTRRSERPTLRRSASFPSPAALTAEESILLKFAAEHPDQASRILAPPASGPVENPPVVIAPIHIAAISETQEAQHWQ